MDFFNDLGKFSRLKTHLKKKKEKQTLIIKLHNYTVICWKFILMNTMIYQLLKEKR